MGKPYYLLYTHIISNFINGNLVEAPYVAATQSQEELSETATTSGPSEPAPEPPAKPTSAPWTRNFSLESNGKGSGNWGFVGIHRGFTEVLGFGV